MEKKQLLQCIDDMTAGVDAVQRRVLEEILARNGESEYLASCGLSSASGGAAAFRAKVPMATYEDLKPYILRVAGGDRCPVLTGSGNPVSEFLLSSGTSGGEPKLIPAVEDELDRRLLLHSLVAPLMNQCVPGLDEGSGLYFHFVRPEATTPGGLPARTVLTSLLKSDRFRNRPYDPYRGHTSPAAAVLCEDATQSMYAQLACGLRHRAAVTRVGAAFAYGLLRAVAFLQRHWASLADDIEAGAPAAPGVLTDPSVRAAVAAALRPGDPDLARLIRAECSSSSEGGERWGAGIIRRLWPNARCLEAIATGAMAQYVPALGFYSAGLPIASTVYAASECHLGLNLDPLCGDPSEACYTLMPTMAYFEFLPLGLHDATELVELARVEPGREYELVVTTYGGLSRYRVGDVLRAEAGLHHNSAAPRFRFVRRAGVLLSVDVDKTDEAELHRAVARASAALPRGAAVLDYTSLVCADGVPGHYVVYWELAVEPELERC
ncbi:hypothetical protein BS78_K048300 [Paspalum vaginatum]|uniref:Uncharacterized protein n=1 Tax=Paspalum vaginatum TaxID=158149 RepID=A0A9W7XCZ3_9POAL|nr:hypothetical protein BS78_K048300 [Paspalum vaginatum]